MAGRRWGYLSFSSRTRHTILVSAWSSDVCSSDLISPDFSPVADHKPYDLGAPDGVTHHLAPGTRIQSGRYPIVTGLEHDELGHPKIGRASCRERVGPVAVGVSGKRKNRVTGWPAADGAICLFQAEHVIRYWSVPGVQTCALPISSRPIFRRWPTTSLTTWARPMG